MKKFIFLISLLFTLPAMAGEPIGLGLGTNPGILRFKQSDKDRKKAIDAAIGGYGNDFYVHGDYLFNEPDFRMYKDFHLDYYVGVGLRAMRHNDEETRIGARVPLGMSMLFNSMPLELFTELSLTADAHPKLKTYLDLGLGFHYYFDFD